MATYVFYATHAASNRRADGCNTVVASGPDVQTARATGEALLGEPGALAGFAAVDLAGAPAFVVQGHNPVGGRNQGTWPTLTKGGDLLKGA